MFFPRWYPHRYDPMTGLFIRQLAESLTHLCDITVLYVHPDERLIRKYEIVSSVENGIKVTRVYYRIPASKVPFIYFQKAFGFFYGVRIGFRFLDIRSFDLIHVHILTRHGFIAFLLRKFSRIPYVITEHWSRYFQENNTYTGYFRKKITRLVVGHALGIIAVSGKLKAAMIRHGLNHPDFRIIPNTVDTDNFKIQVDQVRDPASPKRIIHVSCFDDKSKNISGFLRTIRKISSERQDFTVMIVGEGPDKNFLKKYAAGLGFNEQTVVFPGLITHRELVKEFNRSDFLVVSSHYETFGTVIIEAMACGIPVVSTDVGIASAVINNKNGLLVTTGDEKTLQEAIGEMLDKCRSFDRKTIREGILSRFDQNLIARDIFNFYREVLGR